MAVSIDTASGRLVAGVPHALFQTRIIAPRIVLFQYAVAPDGKRFLINSLPSVERPAYSNDQLSLGLWFSIDGGQMSKWIMALAISWAILPGRSSPSRTIRSSERGSW